VAGAGKRLRVRGRGLTVYPTSAPRATIGGWLAQDGVGPSEYGRLSENVVSADVVMPGGTHRTVAGDKLHPVVGCEKGIVVRATLQTGRAENDTPWLSRAARSLPGPWQASCARKCRCGTRPSSARDGPPLGARGESPHLRGIPRRAENRGRKGAAGRCHIRRRARAIPGRRVQGVGSAFLSHRALVLSARTIIEVGEIPAALKEHANEAVQGTVAGSGEVLLIALDLGEG
jgi:hypothetical protein